MGGYPIIDLYTSALNGTIALYLEKDLFTVMLEWVLIYFPKLTKYINLHDAELSLPVEKCHCMK